MATRSKRFVSGLLTGYATIGINVISTLISIPLALAYLDKEQFGLWALALQISGYLALLEMGMSGALFRFVADYKDDVNGGEYGSLLVTGALVFAIQGVFIAIVGVIFSYFAPALFAIPDHLAYDFAWLLGINSVLAGISIGLRSLSSPLWAFQRLDIINNYGSFGLIVRLLLMWVGFRIGWGVYSLVISTIPTILLTPIAHGWISWRNRYFPNRRHWGFPRWDIFKEIFAFGRDGMLLSIGSQLVNATQIAIISRILGLDAAASFSIGTKLYSMGQQVFHKIIESAAPGLTEIYIRGEIELFLRRYWEVIFATLSFATIGAVALTSGNSAFVELWTSGKVIWSPISDALLGLLIVFTSLSRCFVSLFGITKDLRSVRVLYLIEGVLFVPCAILGAKWYGVEGVLAASLAVHLMIAVSFSVKSASKVLGPFRRLLYPTLLSLALTALALISIYFNLMVGFNAVTRFMLTLLPTSVGLILIWTFTLPATARTQIIDKIPLILRPRKLTANEP